MAGESAVFEVELCLPFLLSFELSIGSSVPLSTLNVKFASSPTL